MRTKAIYISEQSYDYINALLQAELTSLEQIEADDYEEEQELRDEIQANQQAVQEMCEITLN